MTPWMDGLILALAVLAVAVAAGLLRFARRDPPTILLAAFLALWGVTGGAGALLPLLGVSEGTEQLAAILLRLTLFTTLLAFAIVYPDRVLTKGRRRALAALGGVLAVAAAVTLAVPRDPAAYAPVWLNLVRPYMAILYVTGLIILGTRWLSSPRGVYRTQVTWALTVFVFWVMHDGLGIIVYPMILGHAWALPLITANAWTLIASGVWVAGILLALAVCGVAISRLARGRAAPDDRFLSLFAPYAVALTTVQVFTPTYAVSGPAQVHFLMDFLVIPLVVYGVLRFRIVDFDLKVKWGIKQGTVAAALVGMFLTATLGAQAFTDDQTSRTIGFVATALLVLAIAHLRALGDRVANALMPGVRASPEHLSERKLEIYRAALEESFDKDGTISMDKGPLLMSLRRELGITDRDHAILTHGVRAAATPRGGSTTPRPGARILERYRVERVLGEGGHGRTVLARDTMLQRNVVIKTLHAPGRAHDLLREARALSRLTHERIVHVHDVERVGDEVFLILEHVPGGSLADRLATGPLAHETVNRVAVDLLAGLEALHAAGGVHRDVKPANVLLDDAGHAKVADFGVTSLPGRDETLDLAGGLAGTLRYMAPEQARGLVPGPAADQYAAAATLFEAFTGEAYVPRVKGETFTELRMRVASAGAFDATRLPRDVDTGLARWFTRALAPDAGARFPTVTEARESFPGVLEPTDVAVARDDA